MKIDDISLAFGLRDYTDLVENDYVVRTSKTGTKKYNSPALKSVVYRRIAYMGEEWGLPTIKYIIRSGMLAMAKRLLEKDGVLSYKKIMEQFNFNNPNTIKEYINEEIIKKIYGKE